MVIFYILNRFLNKESFQNPSRIRTACTNGKFELNGKCVDGSNDYCYKKNSAIKDNKNSEYQKYYWNPKDKKCIKYVDKLCQSTNETTNRKTNGKTNGKKYKVNTTNGICEEVKMTDEEYCKSLNPVSFLGTNKLCIIGNNNNCDTDSNGLKYWSKIEKKCIDKDNIYCNTLSDIKKKTATYRWSIPDKKCIDCMEGINYAAPLISESVQKYYDDAEKIIREDDELIKKSQTK